MCLVRVGMILLDVRIQFIFLCNIIIIIVITNGQRDCRVINVNDCVVAEAELLSLSMSNQSRFGKPA